MDTQPPNSKKPETNNGCLAPMLVWGSLAAIWGVANLVAENDKALANQIVSYGFIAWLVSLFVYFMAGKNLKETKGNVTAFAYMIGMIVAGVFALGAISLIFPSSCTSNKSQAPADIYYRR